MRHDECRYGSLYILAGGLEVWSIAPDFGPAVPYFSGGRGGGSIWGGSIHVARLEPTPPPPFHLSFCTIVINMAITLP